MDESSENFSDLVLMKREEGRKTGQVNLYKATAVHKGGAWGWEPRPVGGPHRGSKVRSWQLATPRRGRWEVCP